MVSFIKTDKLYLHPISAEMPESIDFRIELMTGMRVFFYLKYMF